MHHTPDPATEYSIFQTSHPVIVHNLQESMLPVLTRVWLWLLAGYVDHCNILACNNLPLSTPPHNANIVLDQYPKLRTTFRKEFEIQRSVAKKTRTPLLQRRTQEFLTKPRNKRIGEGSQSKFLQLLYLSMADIHIDVYGLTPGTFLDKGRNNPPSDVRR